MSVKATILIFVLAALMCSARNIATARNSRHAGRLGAIARHSTARLRQFGSSITCFSLGFGAALALTVFGSFDAKALLLAGLVALVGGSTSCFSVLGTALHSRIGETREVWASVVILIGALCYLLFVLARGFS